ncbi:MAG: DUF2878 family protein [Actinomycetota bacterium]
MKPRLRPIGFLAAFGLGAILGTFWDQLHVRSGTLIYAHASSFGQPWWVPLEFGIASVLIVWLFVTLGDPIPKTASIRVAAIEGVWFTGIYAITAFFDRKPWVVVGLVALALGVRSKDVAGAISRNAIPAVTVLVIGPVVEAMLIESGLYAYRTHQLGPVPVWLILLYANGLLFMLRSTEALLQRFGVRRLVEPANAVVPAPSQEQ